jgi:ribosomal protein S18 acetylase RimI-like enzyme
VGHDWQIRELTEPDIIREYLNSDRLYTPYALGDLEPALFPLCRWWLAETPLADIDAGWALVLHFSGLTPHAVVCVGEASGVGLLLAKTPLPEQIYLICRAEHMAPARNTWSLPAPRLMARMVLAPDQFRPTPSDSVSRLTMEHLDDLQTLYAVDDKAADAFAPYQLADGLFFGVEVDGRLVSVAGTHLIAPTERIGAVGNIFTHPDHRGRGYAAACTSAICAELLTQELTVVLNVGVKNTPAIRLYERLGFREYCTYYETIGNKITKE